MPRLDRLTVFPFVAVVLACSAVLDYDALEKGEKDTDTGPAPECVADSDCDDGHACTTETCEDQKCVYVPDNDKCPGFEACRVGRGCVDEGRECWLSSHCDDQVECTRDECAGDKCRFTPRDEACADPTDLCLLGRVCDPLQGCVGGYTKECTQPDPPLVCRRLVCDPLDGECSAYEVMDGADDDGDGYSDESCGGRDCRDEDPTTDPLSPLVNPDADEICNYMDDDCDGLIDLAAVAGPATLAEAPNLASPSVAAAKGRYAVVWQRTTGSEGSVFLQVLGTRGCVATTDCLLTDGSEPALTPVNLTPLGLVDSGRSPFVISHGDRLYVVWLALPEGGAPDVRLVGVDIDPAGQQVTVDATAELLSTGAVSDRLTPRLAWNPAGDEWVAAWLEELDDGTFSPQVVDASGRRFAGQPVTGLAAGLDIECIASDDCVLVFGAMDTTSGDRVYELRLDGTSGSWAAATGFPRVVSGSGAGAGAPSVTGVGTSWATAFSERGPIPDAGLEDEADLVAVRDGTPTVLFADEAFDQRNAGLVATSDGFGLLYVQEMAPDASLDFRLFDEGFKRYNNQGGRLTLVKDGSVESSPLARIGEGFAAAWVERPGAGDQILRFLAFDGCEPTE